jgi:hypothetical protein
MARTQRKQARSLTGKEVLTAFLESGFAFEADVLRRLRETKWYVEPSVQYFDVESGQLREMDLVARKYSGHVPTNSSICLTLVIECRVAKHGLLVVGQRAKPEYSLHTSELCTGIPPGFPETEVVNIAGRNLVPYNYASDFLALDSTHPFKHAAVSGFHLLQLDAPPGKSPTLRSARNELLLPVSKAAMHIASIPDTEIPKSAYDPEPGATPVREPRWTVVVPLLVVRGPLWFTDSRSTRSSISRISSAGVVAEYRQERRSERVPVTIITERYLPTLEQQCESLFEQSFLLVEKHLASIHKEYDMVMRKRLGDFGKQKGS